MFVRVSCAQLLGDYRGNYYGDNCRYNGGWFGDNNIGADTGVTGESPRPPLASLVYMRILVSSCPPYPKRILPRYAVPGSPRLPRLVAL
jgi:hypothetical protein